MSNLLMCMAMALLAALNVDTEHYGFATFFALMFFLFLGFLLGSRK